MSSKKPHKSILLEVADRIATVTLNRPQKLNAFTVEMTSELTAVFNAIRERPDISVVIVKGAGRSFSSGHDVTEWPPEPPYALESEYFQEQRKVFERFDMYRKMLWELPQPVICQIHGYCLTLGLELAMSCDLVVCADDARLAVRTLGGGGLYFHLLPWLVGARKTKELLFTGRYVLGAEAAVLGIANASVPQDQLDSYVRAMAEQIARVPLTFLSVDKQACNKSLDLMGAREGVEYSSVLHAVSHLTDESREINERMKGPDWKRAVAVRDARYQADGPPPGPLDAEPGGETGVAGGSVRKVHRRSHGGGH